MDKAAAGDNKPKIIIKKRSQFLAIWFRFRKNKLAVIGLVMLIFMILVAIFADVIADYEQKAIT